MKTKLLILLCLVGAQSFAVESYLKGDKLYVILKQGISLYEKPDVTSKIKKDLIFKSALFVSEDKLKKVPFTIEEIQAAISKDQNFEAFQGFSLTGFWVKVITDDKISGYVFDGYLSFLKRDFELTRTYFNKEFLVVKSVVTPVVQSNNYSYNNSFFYTNGAYIVEKGNDYSGHIRYFIPNITLQEAYLLIQRPDLFSAESTKNKNPTVINGDKYSLSFTSKKEKTSLEVKGGKIKGVEITFESWTKN
jgi:hypothetical protein